MTLSDSATGAARRQLRTQLAARRRSLSPPERALAARRVAHLVDQALYLRANRRVAVYAALAGELDAAPLIALARERGCRIYLPRIDRRRASRAMQFVEMRGALRRNRLGIAEPQTGAVLGSRWLDVVFLPLVGFDRHGLRLGTGGGYYDRAFAFRRWRSVWHAPRLVGLAYAFQQVERIAAAPHDVLLDAVATDEGIIPCTTG
ncbi:MAG TPA: 5-formyltetrahydrofolate cyclo-ligase [Steroidobacteraceae bacterium]|nr:5-formyltetrahydrofolate cyclo-ligase [Steroidobacteraceae bacterium]